MHAKNFNEFISNNLKIIKKIGEGGCGTVFEVSNKKERYAMKIEQLEKKYDQLLHIEARVLKRLQSTGCTPTFISFVNSKHFGLLLMELLGESLGDIHRRAPKRQLSINTVLRIGHQTFQIVEKMHRFHIIHRDIKPSNFALGLGKKSRCIFIFDFGLARFIANPENRRQLRKPRKDVAFCGTTSYCSPNVHKRLEPGRHDDLWSLLYMCIEFIVGSLPWKGLCRYKALLAKENIDDKFLLQGCPKEFAFLLNYFRNCTFETLPDYYSLNMLFERCIQQRKILPNDPYDWELWGENLELRLKDLPTFTAIALDIKKIIDQRDLVSLIDTQKITTADTFEETLLHTMKLFD